MMASAQDGRASVAPRMPRRGAGAGRAAAPVLAAWLGLVLCLVLVACGSGSTTAQQGTSATPPGTGATPTGGQTGGGTPSGQTGPSNATPTPFGEGTVNAVDPNNDWCAPQQAPTSSTQGTPATAATPASLPTTIPVYPGAQLRLGSVNGNKGVFGLCTSDSVDMVNSYYEAQLPSHGWHNVMDEMLTQADRQLVGNQSNINLIITIEPSVAFSGHTEITIIYSGP